MQPEIQAGVAGGAAVLVTVAVGVGAVLCPPPVLPLFRVAVADGVLSGALLLSSGAAV